MEGHVACTSQSFRIFSVSFFFFTAHHVLVRYPRLGDGDESRDLHMAVSETRHCGQQPITSLTGNETRVDLLRNV
jgi:hypothetical protein